MSATPAASAATLTRLRAMTGGTRLNDEEGFTLIELLVVIIIIGILAAVALPLFMSQNKEAVKAGIKSDVRNGVALVVDYLNSNNTATVAELASSSTVGLERVGPVKLVRSENTTSVVVTGAWDTYKVRGVGDWGSEEYAYEYDSRLGTYGQVDPVTGERVTTE